MKKEELTAEEIQLMDASISFCKWLDIRRKILKFRLSEPTEELYLEYLKINNLKTQK